MSGARPEIPNQPEDKYFEEAVDSILVAGRKICKLPNLEKTTDGFSRIPLVVSRSRQGNVVLEELKLVELQIKNTEIITDDQPAQLLDIRITTKAEQADDRETLVEVKVTQGKTGEQYDRYSVEKSEDFVPGLVKINIHSFDNALNDYIDYIEQN